MYKKVETRHCFTDARHSLKTPHTLLSLWDATDWLTVRWVGSVSFPAEPVKWVLTPRRATVADFATIQSRWASASAKLHLKQDNDLKNKSDYAFILLYFSIPARNKSHMKEWLNGIDRSQAINVPLNCLSLSTLSIWQACVSLLLHSQERIRMPAEILDSEPQPIRRDSSLLG